jgi:hypothetical protein
MVSFVPPPSAQGSGSLVMHVLDIRSSGYKRVGVWTGQENSAARRLYKRAGMTPLARPLLSGRPVSVGLKG